MTTEPTTGRPRDELWDAFSEICQINPALYGKGRFGKELKPFREMNVTPEQVWQFFKWFSQHDWRGKKGEAPTMKLTAELWPQAFIPRLEPEPQPQPERKRKREATYADILDDTFGSTPETGA